MVDNTVFQFHKIPPELLSRQQPFPRHSVNVHLFHSAARSIFIHNAYTECPHRRQGGLPCIAVLERDLIFKIHAMNDEVLRQNHILFQSTLGNLTEYDHIF